MRVTRVALPRHQQGRLPEQPGFHGVEHDLRLSCHRQHGQLLRRGVAAEVTGDVGEEALDPDG
jgi:hypothetical protein